MSHTRQTNAKTALIQRILFILDGCKNIEGPLTPVYLPGGQNISWRCSNVWKKRQIDRIHKKAGILHSPRGMYTRHRRHILCRDTKRRKLGEQCRARGAEPDRARSQRGDRQARIGGTVGVGRPIVRSSCGSAVANTGAGIVCAEKADCGILRQLAFYARRR